MRRAVCAVALLTVLGLHAAALAAGASGGENRPKVPQPTTMALVAVGAGSAYLIIRKEKKQD